MRISTYHSGYEIHYDETTDLWRASQLSLEAATLSALRSIIDQAELEARQMNVTAFLLDHSGFSIVPVTVVLADRDGKSAWVINRVEDPKNVKREKVSLHRLVADTPENRQLLLAWRDASRAVYEEGQRVSRMRDDIPRMDDTAPTPPLE
ncbi:hypothetical protein C3941_15295 [Kaistia algarum]|uniref:hypothetical protein n=1 Tax=Kaistia algarum TaxID=2083279 RepID=UPI000CE90B98|nr:hypothetical protein [Kaistia algarum]MCX5514438.1 hypothetical protein [Kaistia algarum]PPE79174.1 hypothetical protein C3941_15295 [Kaistia algarum]